MRLVLSSALVLLSTATVSAAPTGTAAGGAPERVVINVPKIPLKVPMLPQAASLTFSKDGKWVAVGLYREVKLIEVAHPENVKVLSGHADVVHSLAFSPDGKWLAAA